MTKPKQIIEGHKIIERRANGRVRVHTQHTEPSRTQQQFRDQVNVNTIIAKYKKTGLMDHVRKNPGVYADMTDLPDYQTALQTVITAQTTFDTIPSNVRHRFDNNPQTFIDFMADPANTDEAVKLGLMIPRPTPTQDVMVTTGGKRTPIPKKENSSDTSEE